LSSTTLTKDRIATGKQGLQEIKGFDIAYISGTWNPRQLKGMKVLLLLIVIIIVIMRRKYNNLIQLSLDVVCSIHFEFVLSKTTSQQQQTTTIDWRESDVSPFFAQLSDPHFKGADILLSNAWPQGILNELG
jgi:hypothetical protein